MHERAVHQGGQRDRRHDRARPCHQAEQVEEDEADLSGDVQAALLEEVGLP